MSPLLSSECTGGFEPIQPLVGDMLVADLDFLHEDEFVEALGFADADLQRLLRTLFQKLAFAGNTQRSVSDSDRVVTYPDGWQVVDFSSVFFPDITNMTQTTSRRLGSVPNLARPIFDLATVLEKLVEDNAICVSKKVCLNLSNSHLSDDDVDAIADGAAQLSACPQLFLNLRLTRLTPAAKLSRLLNMGNLAWIDVCHTTLATIDARDALARLQRAEVDLLILESNPDLLDRALGSLFALKPHLKATSERAHVAYHSIHPPLSERTWLYERHLQAMRRLNLAATVASECRLRQQHDAQMAESKARQEERELRKEELELGKKELELRKKEFEDLMASQRTMFCVVIAVVIVIAAVVLAAFWLH